MNLAGATITQLADMLKSKKVSSSELYDYFKKRIEKYNPDLNVYLTMGEEAKATTGILAGIPLAIKDNFCTKGVRTTASAKVLDTFVPDYESTVTARLLESGTSFLGKTNMDAWAHGSSTETSDYGPTKNPWDQTRIRLRTSDIKLRTKKTERARLRFPSRMGRTRSYLAFLASQRRILAR
jgi:aspartyl-tRNA(Asn)/glutamyl-tRNA(Gln) amidotransferase subunit A